MRPLDPFHAFQDRLSTLLGCEPNERDTLVAGMLQRDATESTGYWLQIAVSSGIALLGVVLGSTAVVIGAMLIAPLMVPIIGLGMGLATGSPFLTFRSLGRCLGSVGLCVGIATLLTLALPYHAMNPEITGRTAPTILDLVVAAFCALAGVYAALRASSDVAITAAGTSIGISLVPPLCVVGFGLGIGSAEIAGGASLLFLTNMVAIVVVGTLAFILAGFARVRVMQLEQEELKRKGGARVARAVARRLTRLFTTRAGSLLRVSMPLVLLAVVFLPLRNGLNDVAWQIRTRTEVEAAIKAVPERVIDSRLRVDHGTVELTLLVVAAAESSQEIAERLARDIHGRTGSNPRIEVIPLADAKAFATLETNLMARPVVTPEPPPPPSPMDGLELGTAALQQAIEKRWPSQLGELLLISLDLGTAPYRIHLLSLGRAPDDATREVLGGAVASDLGREVSLSYTALPSEWIALEKSEQEYLDALRLQLLRGERSLQAWLCIERPAPKGDRGQLWPLEKKSLSQRVEDLVNGRERVALVEGEQHRFVFRKGGCGE